MEVTLNTDAAKPDAATPVPTGTPGVTYVTAKDGRRIGLKKLKPSGRFLLAEAVETKSQSAEMQAIVVGTVFSIGDEAMTPLQSRAELLARLDELGDDGLAAITGPVLSMYGVSLDPKDIETAKN